MKIIKDKTGQFSKRVYFDTREIEDICTQELQALDLYPDLPKPIPIDRFLEKKFNITHSYEELPSGVLGYTEFSDTGVKKIVVASALDAVGTTSSDRRVSTTLAHEAGHALLHMDLFEEESSGKVQLNEISVTKPQILCREVSGYETTIKKYDGKWWEYQANLAIGALLLPRKLVQKALEPLSESVGVLGIKVLDKSKYSEAVILLSEVFEVNPVVAKFRLNEIYLRKT